MFRPGSIEIIQKSFFFFIASAIVFIGGISDSTYAAQVTLAWDASTNSEVDSYNLYYQECSLEEKCTTSNTEKDSLGVWTIRTSELNNASDPTYTIHNLSDSHKYAFALTACNSSGEESNFSNEVNFTPPDTPDDKDNPDGIDPPDIPENQPPKVDAGKDQSIDMRIGSAILSGTATDDGLPENGGLSYKWFQNSGPKDAQIQGPTDLTTSVIFNVPGKYTFLLTASDSKLTASDTVTVNVYQTDPDDTDDATDDQTDDNTDDNTDETAIIIDNADVNNVSFEGTWKTSVGPQPYADDSVYGKWGASFSWHFISPSTGTYDMSVYWTYHSSRSDAVPISIESEKGIEIVTVNQKKPENAAKWVNLGQFQFVAGESYEIKVTAPDKGWRTTSADAVKFELVDMNPADALKGDEVIIDNLDSQYTLFTGDWKKSVGKNPYSDNSVYGKNGATFTWTYVSPSTGVQDVSIWWTYHSTRSSSIPLTIVSEDGATELTLDQQQNESKWVSLGQYNFIAGESYEITLKATQGYKTVCADAIKISSLAQ